MPACPEPVRVAGADFGGVIALPGFGELARAYDGFILDQWGVLHDGTRPYAGAAECLARLRAAGKRIVVLSNSGKREAENVSLMARMGFEPCLFDRFVSAGEDARRAIETRANAFHRGLGSRCYVFTRDGDHALLEGIGLELVESVDAAEFLVVLGSDSPRRGCADYEPELVAGISRKLPMICANPDVWRFSAHGMIEAAGVLARRYQALGGMVFYHGKPYPAIYDACFDALAGCARERILAVGDSIEHDVLGAARVGLACALIAGGVHAGELGVRWGELPTLLDFNHLMAGACAKPAYLLPAFAWS
ncbi:MAG: TIGR01459 family HAD-type hydrolase [Betaproteobacteria bacterium]